MKYTMILVAMIIGFNGCGKVGPAGPVGAPGASVMGPQGSAGTNGSNAASVTIVQFCQSCVTHYPDTFAEIGFCSNGTIYATYSENDGFSAEIPPGVYTSDGVNCACTFTVGANCAVSN